MKKIAIFIFVVLVVTIAVLILSIRPASYSPPQVVMRKITVEREQKSQEEKMNDVSPDSRKYVEGEVVVKFTPGLTQEDIDNFLSQYNLKVKKIISGIEVYNLQLPEGVKVEDIIEKLKQDSRVEYAEPNYLFKLY